MPNAASAKKQTFLSLSERNSAQGKRWVKKFASRATRILRSLAEGRQAADEVDHLFLPLYVPGFGVVRAPFLDIVLDSEWRVHAWENRNGEVEVLDGAFLPSPIYDFLQHPGTSSA